MMKIQMIKRGEWTTFKQDVESLACLSCKYNTGCQNWECSSSGCELTNECFNHKFIGTWCPFGDVPERLKKCVKILS